MTPREKLAQELRREWEDGYELGGGIFAGWLALADHVLARYAPRAESVQCAKDHASGFERWGKHCLHPDCADVRLRELESHVSSLLERLGPLAADHERKLDVLRQRMDNAMEMIRHHERMFGCIAQPSGPLTREGADLAETLAAIGKVNAT